VLLFSYHTSTNSGAVAATEPAAGDDSTAPAAGASTADGSTADGSTADGSTAEGSTSKTYTGDAADTQWGVVQVEITVQSGKVTKSEAIQYPQNNGRDQEINSYALPILVQETIDAQSSDIDMVSGATVTSVGYQQSLQSAIDQASA
jgi:uncharacterized protein with FMN-binding domain